MLYLTLLIAMQVLVDAHMLQIAGEMNLSETAFVSLLSEGANTQIRSEAANPLERILLISAQLFQTRRLRAARASGCAGSRPPARHVIGPRPLS